MTHEQDEQDEQEWAADVLALVQKIIQPYSEFPRDDTAVSTILPLVQELIRQGRIKVTVTLFPYYKNETTLRNDDAGIIGDHGLEISIRTDDLEDNKDLPKAFGMVRLTASEQPAAVGQL